MQKLGTKKAPVGTRARKVRRVRRVRKIIKALELPVQKQGNPVAAFLFHLF